MLGLSNFKDAYIWIKSHFERFERHFRIKVQNHSSQIFRLASSASLKMAILLTGGTGKTATRLAQLLQAAKIPLLLASRGAPSGPNSETPAVKFDWLDATTFSSPFQHNFPNGERITAIYVITPQVQDPTEPVNSFIDVAVKHGVKRFVVLTGSSCELGGRHAGKVWQYLVDSKLDFCILRATWFMGMRGPVHRLSVTADKIRKLLPAPAF